MSTGRKWVLGFAGATALAITAGGVVHLPFARALLARAGSCPFGHASLAELEPARRQAIASERSEVTAPARPALGFELDRTTRPEVRAWAARKRVACKDVREGLVRCRDVPPSSLGLAESAGRIDELHLGFDTHGHLVDVSTMRMHVAGVGAVRDIESRLEGQVGAPQLRTGSFDESHLALHGAEGLSSLRYRYRDYFADVIAMRFDADGLVVREHYMSAND